MNVNLDGYDDMFDSREVIARIEELTDEIGNNEHPDDFVAERQELTALTAFVEEVGSEEFEDGITFISDLYFEDYARELAEDIGAIDPHASWPLNRIDWAGAAEDLLMDYTSYTFQGSTYYGRV